MAAGCCVGERVSTEYSGLSWLRLFGRATGAVPGDGLGDVLRKTLCGSSASDGAEFAELYFAAALSPDIAGALYEVGRVHRYR